MLPASWQAFKKERNTVAYYLNYSTAETKYFLNFGNRTLLCSERAEQLIFCHDNFKNLAPHVKKWKTDMKAFDEEDKAKAAEAAKEKETQGEINK